MKIWVVAVGEPSLIDKGERLHRAGLMADHYSEIGHKVTLFNSTFFHQKKINRFKKSEIISVNENLDLVFLWGRSYRKNIDISRIFSNFDNARSFKNFLNDLEKPDLIILSFPILELITIARKFCHKNDIPFIIDVRDYWPDVFYKLLPSFFKPFISILFFWFNYSLNISLNLSYMIITPFLTGKDWAEKRLHSTVKARKLIKIIPFTTPKRNISNINELQEYRLRKSQQNIVIAYVGTISNMANIRLILKIAKISQEKKKSITFLICGDGPEAKLMRSYAKDLDNVVFKG